MVHSLLCNGRGFFISKINCFFMYYFFSSVYSFKYTGNNISEIIISNSPPVLHWAQILNATDKSFQCSSARALHAGHDVTTMVNCTFSETLKLHGSFFEKN